MDHAELNARARAQQEATSGAIACEVTAVSLTPRPQVTVRPLVSISHDSFDGELSSEAPLEIMEVPYGFPRSNSFAFFIPPEVGMQGFLNVTQTEIGEVSTGEAQTSRRRDSRSGYFIPSEKLTGAAFTGNAEWAELRSTRCRIAASEDTVHVQAGSTALVLTPDGFDVVVNGISLIAALQEMSAHLMVVETQLGIANTRAIDDIMAATPPSRNEAGV